MGRRTMNPETALAADTVSNYRRQRAAGRQPINLFVDAKQLMRLRRKLCPVSVNSWIRRQIELELSNQEEA